MAYRRLSLPPLKLTQRPVFGQKSVHFIHQGLNSEVTRGEGLCVQGNSGSECTVDAEGPTSLLTDADDTTEIIEPTSHEFELMLLDGQGYEVAS